MRKFEVLLYFLVLSPSVFYYNTYYPYSRKNTVFKINEVYDFVKY